MKTRASGLESQLPIFKFRFSDFGSYFLRFKHGEPQQQKPVWTGTRQEVLSMT